MPSKGKPWLDLEFRPTLAVFEKNAFEVFFRPKKDEKKRK